MNISDWFEDVLPIQRKTTAAWALPALLGLGVGIAAGVGLGMLYAPSTGEEARHKLREGATRAKEKAGELAERARDRISSVGTSTANQLHRGS
jgi:gas vesicle protein